MTDLTDRVVVVTGGNGGIGLGIAQGCAQANASVAIWGTNPEKLAAASATLERMGRPVLAQQVDVGSEHEVVAAMEQVRQDLGRIDAVFANAGISGGAPFVDQSMDLWRQVLRVNLDGAVLTLREGARHMIAQGEGGSLVGVSSTSAIHGAPGAQPYAASKAALLAVMRGLAVELARYQIRANSIIPGWTETDMTAGALENEKFLTNTTKRTPARRWGVPGDFSAVGAFLADPTQLYHTGDEIVIDGGYTRF